ncbi:MAG TPA: HU family DNA-binding protein [Thermoanaerobaculia bacterium]
MTKAELIGSVVDSVEGLTRRQATEVFEAVFAAITEAVKAGESAKVPGFGSFTLSERASRKGRNLQASESLLLKASRSVRFKPGKELRKARNVRRKTAKELRETPPRRLRETVQPTHRKHVAKAASAEEISRSVGVTPREAQRVDRILGELGYLQRGLRRSRTPSNLG